MQKLIQKKDKIKEIKKKVDSMDSSLFDHYVVSNSDISEETISVVMTSSNRSKQTYFTLDSMLKNNFKKIHIILVDDSDVDPIEFEVLKTYPYYIDFIVINKKNKNWVNPCVNYNIGFKFIKGEKVVIQNAEVCHVGHVLDFINKNMKPNTYNVFDVKAVSSYENNEKIYTKNFSTNPTEAIIIKSNA
jgi:hypothetical protein